MSKLGILVSIIETDRDVLRPTARLNCRVVIEKTVQSGTVDGDLVRRDNAQSPAVGTRHRIPVYGHSRGRELWVEERSVVWEW